MGPQTGYKGPQTGLRGPQTGLRGLQTGLILSRVENSSCTFTIDAYTQQSIMRRRSAGVRQESGAFTCTSHIKCYYETHYETPGKMQICNIHSAFYLNAIMRRGTKYKSLGWAGMHESAMGSQITKNRQLIMRPLTQTVQLHLDKKNKKEIIGIPF